MRALVAISTLVLAIAPATAANAPQPQMSDEFRAEVRNVVVFAGTSPTAKDLTGSYEKRTSGFVDGANEGGQIGKGVSKEFGGVVLRIPLPKLTIPGMIVGGAKGMTEREIQDFRDALTDKLADAENPDLNHDALAADVFWRIRSVPGLGAKLLNQSPTVPAGTDSVLYVSLYGVDISVDGSEALITMKANATLRRLRDGHALYDKAFEYQDQDTLSNWTKDNNALWHNFVNFSRHSISRDIAAELFERVAWKYELNPAKTRDLKLVKKDPWRAATKSTSPTLAWELTQPAATWASGATKPVDEQDIRFDVEVYDQQQLVYSAAGVAASEHRVGIELPACSRYRWSVRPSHQNSSRFGEWMQRKPSVEERASDAPAYSRGFAEFSVKC
ncbi:MAG: hypothetical protein K0U72_05155 [Gammaproteobacteria bacterium]|nr:hypothetical protein [Gammaproteobacteria bacterium]